MNKRGKNKYFSHYNFFPKNSRGSHVEVIISFIIFVTFIFFIFSILEPSISTQKDKKNIFDNIEVGIMNEISSDMTVITVKFASGEQNCVYLNNIVSKSVIENKIVVKDDLGKTMSSSINGNSLLINGESSVSKIYYSEEFDELEPGSECLETSYELGLTKTSEYIFETKVLDLIEQYNNYETLKSDLKVPEGVEFGYGIKLSNGTTFETHKEENLSINVYIRETPIEYVDLEGNILAGYIKTKIW